MNLIVTFFRSHAWMQDIYAGSDPYIKKQEVVVKPSMYFL